MVEERSHVQAARWVVVVGHAVTALVLLSTMGAALTTALTWSPVALLATALLAGLGAAWNALVRGFARHSPARGACSSRWPPRASWAVSAT